MEQPKAGVCYAFPLYPSGACTNPISPPPENKEETYWACKSSFFGLYRYCTTPPPQGTREVSLCNFSNNSQVPSSYCL